MGTGGEVCLAADRMQQKMAGEQNALEERGII